MSKTVLVLGAGFAGLTVANRLRKALGRDHRVTTVDKRASFVMDLASLEVLAERRHPGVGVRELEQLNKKGIEFVRTDVRQIELGERVVRTGSADLSYDYLVIALGTEQAPDTVSGFVPHAYNLCTADDVARFREAVASLSRGTVLVAGFGSEVSYGPALYEAGFLLDDSLRQQQKRSRVSLMITTPERHPLGWAGPEVEGKIQQLLDAKGITLHTSLRALRIDGEAKRVIYDGREVDYDILLGFPPRRAPDALRVSGLIADSGWLGVDRKTLQTTQEHVYGVGDVAEVKMAQGEVLPKLGTFAEEEAKVVAQNIAAEVEGRGERVEFAPSGYCFLEVKMGDAAAILIDYPADKPRVSWTAPHWFTYKQKQGFEEVRLREWF